jgi:hypothetical protein
VIFLWLAFSTSFLVYLSLIPNDFDNDHQTTSQFLAKATGNINTQWIETPFNHTHLEPAFQQCLEATPFDNTPRRARFAIVQSKNTGYTGKYFDLATSSMRCYARRHGGLFFPGLVQQ